MDKINKKFQEPANVISSIKNQNNSNKLTIPEILLKQNKITENQFQTCLKHQKKTGKPLTSILVLMGYVKSDTIINILNKTYNYQVIKISEIKPDPALHNLIPFKIAKKYMAFPLWEKQNKLVVTMSDPSDLITIKKFEQESSKNLIVYASNQNDIIEAYKNFYKISNKDYNKFIDFKNNINDDLSITPIDNLDSLLAKATKNFEKQSINVAKEDYDEVMSSDAPIINLVNGILVKAVNDRVSDIHIEPFKRSLRVRYRLDGSLYKSMDIPLSIKNAVISRIKILAELDIAERRMPQDGRIQMQFKQQKAVDFRVSTLPTLFGESVVLRILDQSSLNIDITKLGFTPDIFKSIQRCINRPYGLILVTGPTGSGKTTTLYSILNELNKEDTKILTAEQPVEFNFKGINQVPVKEDISMTFATALRAFLRQDPDIIMVGEIRDFETAEIAIKAAMTGHLVLSTLHTNDCASTIGRLVNIGIPLYMLASAVTMVLAQRLIRKLCPECKQKITKYTKKDLELYGFSKHEISNLELYESKGCLKCNGTGFKGRTGLFELMEVTNEISKAININRDEDHLRKLAKKQGMTTLRKAGLEKILQGVTSLKEVLKKTTITKETLPLYLVNESVEIYEDKDIIIREGNTDIDFFQLIQGALLVVKKNKKIGEIVEPKEYFGEKACITGRPRSASIISHGRTIIKRFPGNKLSEIIEKYPEIAKPLFKGLANRLHHANKTITYIADKIFDF